MATQRVRSVISLRVPLWRLRRWLPAVMLAGLGGSVVAIQPPAPPAAAQADAAANPPAGTSKRYSNSFDKASWDVAFAWLEKITGQRLITTYRPSQTLTLKVVDLAVPDIIDLYNEALAGEKYILVRREQSFSIYPADEKLPKDVIRRVTVADLPDLGKSEFVSVMIPLKNLVAADMATQVKKMLSNFGDVYAFGTNNLVIEDKVGNIRTLMANLKELTENDNGPNDTLKHVCKYDRASRVAVQLAKLLTDSTTKIDVPGVQPGQFGQPGFFPQPQFDDRSRDRGRDRNSTPCAGHPLPQRPDRRLRRHEHDHRHRPGRQDRRGRENLEGH